jgi:hypothetical protein
MNNFPAPTSSIYSFVKGIRAIKPATLSYFLNYFMTYNRQLASSCSWNYKETNGGFLTLCLCSKTVKFKEMQSSFTTLLKNYLSVAAEIQKNVFAYLFCST